MKKSSIKMSELPAKPRNFFSTINLKKSNGKQQQTYLNIRKSQKKLDCYLLTHPHLKITESVPYSRFIRTEGLVPKNVCKNNKIPTKRNINPIKDITYLTKKQIKLHIFAHALKTVYLEIMNRLWYSRLHIFYENQYYGGPTSNKVF